MKKNEKKHPLRWITLAWSSFKAIKYVTDRPHLFHGLKDNIQKKHHDLNNFRQSLSQTKNSYTKLQTEIKNTQPTVRAIQQEISRFEYKLDPRLRRIQELQTHLQSEINHAKSQFVSKKRK